METSDWRAMVDESLEKSVQTTEEKITSHAAISEWLKEASYEAAVGIQGVSDRTGMDAYHQLSAEFEETFSPLFEAVRAATHGCGRVTLDWQPGDPRRTKIRIDFGQEFPVHLYEHFENISDARIDRFLTRLVDHLPRGAPYPKKPHRVGAVLSYDGGCTAVRLTEVVTDGEQRKQFVTIYRGSQEHHRDIPFEEAAQHVASFLEQAAG